MAILGLLFAVAFGASSVAQTVESPQPAVPVEPIAAITDR